MKKIILIIIAALTVIAAAAALLIFLPGAGKSGQSSIPEFILPESSQQDDSKTETGASESNSQQTPAASQTSSRQTEQTSDTTTLSSSEISSKDMPQESSSQPEQTSASSSAATEPQKIHMTTETNEIAATDETAEPQPEPVPENVLITSGDPLHYVRLEFTERRVRFSGIYTGDKVKEVIIHKPNIVSNDLFCDGDSFRGSLDITLLTPDYYIIVVRLESGAGMYYVFEKTLNGSRAVPPDDLPAASNLAAAVSPLEIPEQGVLQHITLQDKRRAAEILSEIKSLSDQICAGITEDYDKARALAQWVAVNMYYDKDASQNGVTDEEMTLDFVLENHRSVCFGWSNLYSALCQAQGIECYNASGSVVTGSRCFLQTESKDERAHSWNMVVIDGRQIWVDTVWNSSNSYQKKNYNAASNDMQYFDIDNTLLANDHRVTRFEHRDYFAIIE